MADRRETTVGSTVTMVMALCLAVAACTGDSDVESDDSAADADGRSTSSTVADSTTEPPDQESDEGGGSGTTSSLPEGALTEAEAREVLAELDGQLALGDGPIVAVVRPDGLSYVELDGGPSSLASQPTWSTGGGRLAWSFVSADGQGAKFQAFDEEGVTDGDPGVSPIPGPPVFYFQWNEADDELIYLRNSPFGGSMVEAGVVSPGEAGARIAEGRPFFVSWNPEDRVFAGHIGEERVALFDPAADVSPAPGGGVDNDEDEAEQPGADTLDEPGEEIAEGGGFSAPAWLDGDRLLVVDGGSLTSLGVGTGRRQPLLIVDEPMRFVVSPDRSKVALVASFGRPTGEPMEAAFPAQQADPDGGLIVLDVASGETTLVTDQPALAWEWSPDGSKLAWLEADGSSLARREARWRFWSPSGPVVGDTTSPVIRLSSKEAVSYLPFFAQYAQSITRWSPDSSAFAVAGAIGNRAGIWIQLVDQLAEPVLIAPGDFVTWGSGPTPPPVGGLSPA